MMTTEVPIPRIIDVQTQSAFVRRLRDELNAGTFADELPVLVVPGMGAMHFDNPLRLREFVNMMLRNCSSTN